MTERGRGSLKREAAALAIGPSAVTWDGTALTVEIAEVTAPIPSRLRGRVRVHPGAVTGRSFALDAAGAHRWWPIAPSARVEVDLSSPSLRWSGEGYLDTNAGDAPLERDFTLWNWSRAGRRDGGAAILYEAERRDGETTSLALHCDRAGAVQDFDPPPRVALPATRWRVARVTRAEAGHSVTVRQRLEDAPFYSRSVLATRLLGEPVTAVHESLSLDRFRAPWVQLMLPFRMPRALR